MCLLAVIYQTIPECPVLVLANREEFLDRPSAPQEIVLAEKPANPWLGGRDLRAGGTWLGINRAGVIAAVTNRPKTSPPDRPKSRGLLCRELLEAGNWKAAVAEFRRQWSRETFAGFNLMLLSRERGLVFSATDRLYVQRITPGIHAVTNADWDDLQDPRINRIRGLLREFQETQPSLEEWITQAQSFCSLGEEAGSDALCLPSKDGRGTVSSSIILLPDDLQKAQYRHAAGSPAVTSYEDFSPALATLLENPKP